MESGNKLGDLFRPNSGGVIMLKAETITINDKEYTRTWSDAGKMIERDGALYEEAVDPVNLKRNYSETEQEIPDQEATEAEYLAALDRLGVSEDD